MDFTREPIVQTVITPKEGCKIVVRSSKNSGQEEFFVDAVEVVSFGTAIFFRSLERPKSFLVPATDYEVLEVRETRMVLKNVGIDKAIKIAGGREASVRSPREQQVEKHEPQAGEPEAETATEEPAKTEGKSDARLDKKRDRRRNSRRRRNNRDEAVSTEEGDTPEAGEAADLPKPQSSSTGEQAQLSAVLTSLLPPPATLISETIARYRDNVAFKNAFFSKEGSQEETKEEPTNPPTVVLEQPEFGSFEVSEEEEEEIYQERHSRHVQPESEEELANEELPPKENE